MNLSSSIPDVLFSQFFSELQSGKLKLLYPYFSLIMPNHDTSLEEWVESSINWHASIKATAFVLDSNSLKCVVDDYFFPERSVLMSSTWKYFSNDILLASGDFLSAIELQCRNACSCELCGCLSMLKFLE